MIPYRPGFFGLPSLGRVHGSAVYKAMLPSVASTALLFVYHATRWDENEVVLHPFAIGAFVGFFTFLLTFRLSYGYQRYWEAVTTIHQMLSKWLDLCVNLAAFHYQSAQFADILPPSCGDYPGISQVTGRDRTFAASLEETQALLESCRQPPEQRKWWRRRMQPREAPQPKGKSINSKDIREEPPDLTSRIPIPLRFQEQFTRASQANKRSSLRASFVKQARPSHNLVSHRSRTPVPSLFLQESAHLISLLSAVAMSTLRNDMEEAESPLVEYIPGKPWPPKDPDDLPTDVKEAYGERRFIWRWFYFMLGLNRSDHHRTLYNAARPFAVLGGVSDRECEMLQRARGPCAKVSLCTLWLQEFIARESLAGSTGKVPGPILSRLYQFTSDGMLGYHQARKVSRIPFPYVHAQLTSFFTFAILLVFPLLFVSYAEQRLFAGILNFTSVLCFLGVHEVARELEAPLQAAPNDLPLLTYQAQFNEALVTMYAGYHPEAWWKPK